MNPIYNNPFRILGLPINATEREIAKQINTLATYAEMGKIKSVANDFPFLPIAERTPDVIEDAKKQIEQKQNRFLYSLFWFWCNNSVDELALDLLSENKIDKAIEIWGKSIFASKNKLYKSEVLVENLIRSSSAWSKQDDEDHCLKRDEDEYIVERKIETSYSVPSVYTELNNDDNWTIECDTTWLDGVDNSSYGIVFGRDNIGSFYFFGIAGSGSYMYAKYNEWAYTPYIEWRDTNKFNKRSSNNLKIEKDNSILKFFVNGVHVDTWEAEPFFGKEFGFKVTNNQKIAFRNFKFSKLVEEEIYGEGINISSRNFSNIKNLSTLYLSLATNNGTLKLDYFNKGIALAKNFFSNDSIKDYSKLIAGERYVYNPEKTIHFYLSDLIDSLKYYLDKSEGISTSQLIDSFSNFPIEAKQFLNNKFVAKQIQNIDREIETSQSARKASAGTAIDIGKTLKTNTKTDLDYLRKTLGKTDYQYQTISDKLSLEVVQCGIEAFNFCKTPSGEIDYVKAIKNEENYLKEYEYALNIAATGRAKERAKENLDSCKQYIENKANYSCWFCGNNPPEEKSKFKIDIYSVTNRTYFPRRVQYSYVSVSIPRCSKCQKFHSRTEAMSVYAFIVLAIVGLTIGIVADGYWFGGLLIGGFIGWVAGKAFIFYKTKRTNIRSTSHSTIRNYPAIKSKFSEGWQFSQPKA